MGHLTSKEVEGVRKFMWDVILKSIALPELLFVMTPIYLHACEKELRSVIGFKVEFQAKR